jgi:hypothetical protein
MSKSIEERRIQAILQIRLDGAESWDVEDFIAEKEKDGEAPWAIAAGARPLTRAKIAKIIEAADTLMIDAYSAYPPETARHLAMRRNLYARAVAAGEIATAARILRDIREIEGGFEDIEEGEDEEDDYRSLILLEIKKRASEIPQEAPTGLSDREVWQSERRHGPAFFPSRWFNCQGQDNDTERMRFHRALVELVEEGLVIQVREDGSRWSNVRLSPDGEKAIEELAQDASSIDE